MNTSFTGTKACRLGIGGILLGAILGLLVLLSGVPEAGWSIALGLIGAPAVVGVGAFLVGRSQDRLLRNNDAFSKAKARFSSLTRSAISEDDWQVPLHDSHVPTCWQAKDCQSGDCPAYGKHHIRCWLLAGTYCRGETQGTFAQKLGDCTKCEVYQESVDRGSIDEIAEDFNCLMWTVREKEEILAKTNDKLRIKYSELDELQKKTQEIAYTDTLTGLPNYSHFMMTLKKEMGRAKRYGRAVSLIALDLDNFKHVNDRYGYRKGDQVLQILGKLLAEEIRDCDYAARYGSEKFVILMPETDGAGAVTFAERLQTKTNRVAEDTELPVSAIHLNIGISDFPDCAADIDSLLSASDSALLFAQRKGGNRVSYFCDLSETEFRKGDLERLESRLEGAGLHTIRALADAVDATDLYPSVHRAILVQVAGDMAAKLGMDNKQTDCLALAACLHDIGKIGVPAAVLQKQQKLTREEQELVRRHPEMGGQLLQEAKQIQNLVTAILYHHERWDGAGYPEGLRGEQIPLMARIVGILDAYRAMRCDRPYRKALTVTDAILEMRAGAGSQFDPELVELFVEMVQREEAEELRHAV